MAIVFGKVCERHPKLKGRRYSSSMNRCTGCAIGNNLKNKESYMRASRKWRAKPEVKAMLSRAVCDWAARNPGAHTANVRKYQLRKLQRTPPWANLEKIKSIYMDAAKRGLVVDHVIPLRGKHVSGLHVETNLRAVRKSENARKGNSFYI